ncbi:MAG: hypothetical protein JSS81_03595 [Acidobacteria bacterium]|nr:hypothetical protein [Acidobacteriota bacterium]
MAINTAFIKSSSTILKRPSDRSIFLAAAIGFPLIVVIGFSQSYFSRLFFDAPPLPNALVHLHGLTMMLWVVFFIMQIALVRIKNVRLHRTLGMIGAGLAAVVFTVGLLTAYDSQFVRHAAPPGIDPHKFFLIPAFDMALFALFVGGAVYYRKRPAEHKTLMLLTVFNFLGSPVSRIPLGPPEYTMVWAFGVPAALALGFFVWYSVKHGKINKVFAAGLTLFLASLPLRFMIAETETWLRIADRLAPR